MTQITIASIESWSIFEETLINQNRLKNETPNLSNFTLHSLLCRQIKFPLNLVRNPFQSGISSHAKKEKIFHEILTHAYATSHAETIFSGRERGCRHRRKMEMAVNVSRKSFSFCCKGQLFERTREIANCGVINL